MTETLQTPLAGAGADGPAPTIAGVEQRRIVASPIPGPRSQELHARKTAAVAAGVGVTLPVYIVKAGGGDPRRRRRQLAHRLRLGHRRDQRGQRRARASSRRVQEQVAQFTHTCFMVTPYEGYVAVCEALNRLTPGDHEKRSALFNSGAEAVENAVKIARAHTGRAGRRRLRPRLPRPHEPHDGADGEEHAVQARLRAVRRRDLPRADVVPVPRPRRADGARLRPSGRSSCIEKQVGARQRRRGRDRADPGRGRLRRAGAGLPRRRSPTGARPTASCSWPTRSRPASPAPATGSRATHEGVVPDLITTAKGIAGGLPLAGRDRPRRDHGRRARRRPRRHLRRQPGGVRRRARRHRDHRAARTCRARRAASRR